MIFYVFSGMLNPTQSPNNTRKPSLEVTATIVAQRTWQTTTQWHLIYLGHGIPKLADSVVTTYTFPQCAITAFPNFSY